MSADKSKVNLASPDVRASDGKREDPFWPELALNFPATPSQVYDWATLIFNASDFLELFEQEENNNE